MCFCAAFQLSAYIQSPLWHRTKIGRESGCCYGYNGAG
jgi:hypothetical protein